MTEDLLTILTKKAEDLTPEEEQIIDKLCEKLDETDAYFKNGGKGIPSEEVMGKLKAKLKRKLKEKFVRDFESLSEIRQQSMLDFVVFLKWKEYQETETKKDE